MSDNLFKLSIVSSVILPNEDNMFATTRMSSAYFFVSPLKFNEEINSTIFLMLLTLTDDKFSILSIVLSSMLPNICNICTA